MHLKLQLLSCLYMKAAIDNVNEQARLCSNKTLFTKLTDGQMSPLPNQFVNP